MRAARFGNYHGCRIIPLCLSPEDPTRAGVARSTPSRTPTAHRSSSDELGVGRDQPTLAPCRGVALARERSDRLRGALPRHGLDQRHAGVPGRAGPRGALDGTNDPDAANYCAGPRLAANGLPLERTHAFYVLHAAPLSIVAAPVARLWPADSHRAIRLTTVALMALCAGFVAWGVLRGPRGGRSPWTLAALSGWCLSPGLWGLARIGYSEFYVGFALWLALATLPAPGAALHRVALGGLGIGVLLASKTYGAVPLAIVTGVLLLEDLRRRRAPTRAFVFAAVAALTAAGTWGAACALHGIPPVESLREFVTDLTGYRARGDWSLLATLEALPRTLGARLPGFEWHGVVLLACLARGAGPAGLDPRRVAVWFTCFLAPYTAAPFGYRLFPLLIALPALAPAARTSPMEEKRVGRRWPAMLIDTLWFANVLRIAWPGLLKSNSRWIPLVALVIVAAAWALSRLRRPSPSGDVARPRVLSLALATAWLAMGVHGMAWQAGNWGRPRTAGTTRREPWQGSLRTRPRSRAGCPSSSAATFPAPRRSTP